MLLVLISVICYAPDRKPALIDTVEPMIPSEIAMGGRQSYQIIISAASSCKGGKYGKKTISASTADKSSDIVFLFFPLKKSK